MVLCAAGKKVGADNMTGHLVDHDAAKDLEMPLVKTLPISYDLQTGAWRGCAARGGAITEGEEVKLLWRDREARRGRESPWKKLELASNMTTREFAGSWRQ